MGGSGSSGGGGGFFPAAKPDLEKLVQEAREETARKELEADINRTLRELLAGFERDPQLIRNHLETIGDMLKDAADMEQLMFGGSVAKHTYVDGLSDVDALVCLKQEGLEGKTPQAILSQFAKLLRDRLTSDKVLGVDKGHLAVTVKYRDGTEIQLLPAIRSGDKVEISNASGKEWREINPKAFHKDLSNTNARLGGRLVPAIKLVKSIIAGLPERERLTGYHVESLAVEAVKGYRRSDSVRDLVVHVLREASQRVMSPIGDITGQSRVVDDYLGKAESAERRAVSSALANVVTRLTSAKTASEWKTIIEQ